jgi:hypothetical protein
MASGTRRRTRAGARRPNGRSRSGSGRQIKRGVRELLGIGEKGAPTPQPAEGDARGLAISAEVDAVVAAEIARRERAAQNAALDALAIAPEAPAEELARYASARASGALEELSTYRTADEVGGVVSQSFGAGRNDGLDILRATYGDRLKALVYSAVMDGGTCVECAQWDGAQFPPDYDQTPPGNVKAPNPSCAGGRTRCRCVFVAILTDETDPVVGPTKGPLTTAAAARPVEGEHEALDEEDDDAPRTGRRLGDIHIHEATPPAAAPDVTINNQQPAPPQIAITMPPIQLTIQIPGREPITKTVEMVNAKGETITATVKES